MNIENDKLFDLYTLATLTYEKKFNNVVKNVEDLYPSGWGEIKNYKLKIEIVAEAIKENQLIINTKKYQDTIGDVKKIFIKQ